MKVTIEVGNYIWGASVQKDTEAVLCYEQHRGAARFNHYAIATVNLVDEIRRIMGDNGISCK